MNRLVLIGNGFDLAHGMKTSYTDFIEDYWYSVCENLRNGYPGTYEDDFISITDVFPIPYSSIKKGSFDRLKSTLKSRGIKINIKNQLLEKISSRISLNRWADIEDVYYEFLTGYSIPERNSKITQLNNDFEQLKSKLTLYLDNLPLINTQLEAITRKIYTSLSLLDFTVESQLRMIESDYNKYLSIKSRLGEGAYTNIPLDGEDRNLYTLLNPATNFETVKDKILASGRIDKYYRHPDNTLLLNFNYTSTADKYLASGTRVIIKSDIIFIHGNLKDIHNNPIIFGYGDELDSRYHDIESLNNNDFLENIKSVAYLRTANYKNLLTFIESDEFQVFIMGHSCGLSDRTLLNTIFEHDNCKSIKVFYHQKSDGSDNYSDLVRNISRHFKDKAKMRDRVVNKTFCSPLL